MSYKVNPVPDELMKQETKITCNHLSITLCIDNFSAYAYIRIIHLTILTF